MTEMDREITRIKMENNAKQLVLSNKLKKRIDAYNNSQNIVAHLLEGQDTARGSSSHSRKEDDHLSPYILYLNNFQPINSFKEDAYTFRKLPLFGYTEFKPDFEWPR